MNIKSMSSSAPVVVVSDSPFKSESVARVFLDEGLMSVVASFLGSCHNLDVTCYAVQEVTRRIGQYSLTWDKSMNYVFEISYNFEPFMKLRNPSIQCRLKLRMSWTHFYTHRNVISALRIVKVHLMNEHVQPELLAFLPDLQSLSIGQAVMLANISFLRSMPNLREICLTGLAVQDFSPLLSCKNLRVVKLPQARVSEEQLVSLFISNGLIETLHIPNVDTPQLRFASFASRLKELNIKGRARYPIDALYKCGTLETLEVSKSSICAKYIRNLGSLRLLIIHCSRGALERKEIRDLRQVVKPKLKIQVISDA